MADDRDFPIVPCTICLLLGLAFGGGVAVLSDSSQTVIDGLQAELQQQERASTNHATELQAANEEAADLRSQLRLSTATAKWAEDERDAAAARQGESEKKLAAAMDGNTPAVEVEQLKVENRNLRTAISALESNAEFAKTRIDELLKASGTTQRIRSNHREPQDAQGINGDGHDWNRLSDRDKIILCNKIAKVTGRHTGWIYREFLGNFYYNKSALDTDIAEAASVAAAMDLKSD